MSIKLKDVYAVSQSDDDSVSSHSRIGVAFVNDDGSLNVVLDAIPFSGRLYIQDRYVMTQKQRKEKNDEEENLDGCGHHSYECCGP